MNIDRIKRLVTQLQSDENHRIYLPDYAVYPKFVEFGDRSEIGLYVPFPYECGFEWENDEGEEFQVRFTLESLDRAVVTGDGSLVLDDDCGESIKVQLQKFVSVKFVD